MLHQLEKAQAIARCSLALGGSLHPRTRHAIRELINQVDAEFLERVCSVTTPTGANGRTAVDVNISPDRLVLEVVKRHAGEVWLEPHWVCASMQRELQRVVDRLWSVSSAVEREIRLGVSGGRDDVDRLLDALLDEVKRMEKALSPDQMKIRLRDWVLMRGYDQAVALPLHYIYAAGPVTTSEFVQLMGHSLRSSARQAMTKLLEDDLLRLNEDSLDFRFSENMAVILIPELCSWATPGAINAS